MKHSTDLFAASALLYSRRALILLVVAFGLLALPGTAWADPNDQVAEYADQAQEGYDMLEFEDAVTAAQAGIEIVEREGLRTPEAAHLFIVLGMIRHADGDDDLAEDAFVRAIETYEDAEVDPMYRTPALSEMMERAAERAEPPPEEPQDDPDERRATDDEPTPDIDSPPPEDEVDALTHRPLRRADAGEELMIIADIPEDLPVFRVHVHHRRYGEEDFSRDEMEPTDATGFAFVLESSQVRSSQLEYFITAIDRTGETLAESGRRTNPHRVSVIGSFDEEPVADSDPIDDPIDDDYPRAPSSTGFYGTLALGTDFGFLPGGTAPTANQDRSVSPGLAPAFAHGLLDLGWRISDYNNVGLYFRWQFSPHQNFDNLPEGRIDDSAPFWQHQDECFGIGLPGDCLLGLKYERTLSTDIPEFYSSVGFGVGRVRNWLQLKQATSEADPDPSCEGREIHEDEQVGQYCQLRDTVRTGWVHFGVGGGMYIPVHENFDIVADSYLMVLVPDTSVNIDINLGVRFRM